jgi:hypothetical protein
MGRQDMATGGRTLDFARQCRCRLSGERLGPNYPARRRSGALPAAARAFPASLLFARRSSPRRTPKKRSDKHDGAKVAASLPLDTAITAIPIDFRAAPVAITGDLLIDAGAHTG